MKQLTKKKFLLNLGTIPDYARMSKASDWFIDFFLILFSISMILPLIILISNAFKTPQELLLWPPTLVPENPTLDNIFRVLGETPLLYWIWNSVSFALLSTISIVTTSAIAGYILGKFRFFGINIIFM